MPGLGEVIGSITGAYLLATRDLDGYKLFNQSIEGFWRSFAAVLLIAPFYFLFAGIELELHSLAQTDADAEPATADTGFYAGAAVSLALSWIIFPVVMVFVSRGLGFSQHYVRYIIAFNWSSVIVVALLMIPTSAFYLGAISIQATALFHLLFLVPVLYYHWFIARTALETSGLVATGLVLLEFTLDMTINKYVGQMFG